MIAQRSFVNTDFCVATVFISGFGTNGEGCVIYPGGFWKSWGF